MNLWKKELMIQEEDWQDCSNTQVGMQKRCERVKNVKMRKCESITQSAQWNQLDTPDAICILLAKLPGRTRDKWARRMLNIRKGQMRELDLVHFIETVKDETLLVNEPLFSK